MKTTLKLSILLACVSALPSSASVLIHLDPGSGAITGTPGHSTGWGFTVEADPTRWVSFVGSFLLDETNSALGVYSDLIGINGGPVNYLLPPAAPDWTQAFSNPAQTGLGRYQLSVTAQPGAQNSAILRVLWAEYTADPYSCRNCFARSSYQDFGVRITAVAGPIQDAPEPATWLAGVVAGLLVLYRSRHTAAPTRS